MHSGVANVWVSFFMPKNRKLAFVEKRFPKGFIYLSTLNKHNLPIKTFETLSIAKVALLMVCNPTTIQKSRYNVCTIGWWWYHSFSLLIKIYFIEGYADFIGPSGTAEPHSCLGFCGFITFLPIELESCSNPRKKVFLCFDFKSIRERLGLNCSFKSTLKSRFPIHSSKICAIFGVKAYLGEVRGFLNEVIEAWQKYPSGN